MNILDMFPLYVPHSSGSDSARTAIALEAIARTLPELAALATELHGSLGIQTTKSFPTTPEDFAAAEALRVHLDREGSDKGGFHLYHFAYGTILRDREKVRAVCEIGLGTNNLDVVSNMGAHGRPGASHRAFRDYLQHATIYGGDVDARVLFQEDRIVTTHVDQTDEASLKIFFSSMPNDLDLVIDDGLHSPFANLLTFRYGLSKIKKNGWLVVEDIQANSLPVWQTVSAFLPVAYKPHLLAGRGGMLFAVQRV